MAYYENEMRWDSIDEAYEAATKADCDVYLLWRDKGAHGGEWNDWSLWDSRCGIAGREQEALDIARMMGVDWQVANAEGQALDDCGNWLHIA